LKSNCSCCDDVTGKNEGTLNDGESEKSIEAEMSLSISSVNQR
jgi:hypothetical protein